MTVKKIIDLQDFIAAEGAQRGVRFKVFGEVS
jgi:hypothetical protein